MKHLFSRFFSKIMERFSSHSEDDVKNALLSIQKRVPAKVFTIISEFMRGYLEAVEDPPSQRKNVCRFLELLNQQIDHPFTFEPYHQKIRKPFDYYHFGLDFIRPLIDLKHSKIFGMSQIKKIQEELHKGENVILFANHQTETDPLAISILLEDEFPQLAESVIYVAGERVVTDPLAIPFSMGCDLLCIYSKRYIDFPLEEKADKQLHNKSTMELMSRLLKEGGKIIYVAPSGGRDRKNAEGVIEVASFDPDSIEMFHLMAKKSKRRAHFYPLALATYDLLPPPETIQRELGEARFAKRTPIFLSFLEEFDMDGFPASEGLDKLERRKKKSHAIHQIVAREFERIFKET